MTQTVSPETASPETVSPETVSPEEGEPATDAAQTRVDGWLAAFEPFAA